jgi:hypothetical protein
VSINCLHELDVGRVNDFSTPGSVLRVNWHAIQSYDLQGLRDTSKPFVRRQSSGGWRCSFGPPHVRLSRKRSVKISTLVFRGLALK